jgi:amidase
VKDELIGYDGVGLGELIRAGQVTALELVELTIQRIEKVNPQLNAVVHKMYDEARRAAREQDVSGAAKRDPRSPFCGVPFLLKDLIAECTGTPFSEGCRAVDGYVSRIDSELVRRYKAGGLIMVGKTNTPEFGLLPTTEPALFGPTVNPWDPHLTPGGSSGGSAAAVAAGIVPMAHGNDGGGSIRIPSSCCGIFGLKPSRGRNPLGPLFGDVASGIAYEHALTRSVRDSAALLDVTSGPDLGDPYYCKPTERPFLQEVGRDPGRLKIGFLTSVPEGYGIEGPLHPDCEAAVKDAATLCEGLGHTVEEVAPSKLGQSDIWLTFRKIFSSFAGHAVKYWERELGKKIGQQDLEPTTWAVYQAGLQLTGADYLVAVEDFQKFGRKIARCFAEGGYDVLMTPTLATSPVTLGQFKPSPEDPKKFLRLANSFAGFTRIYNLGGQPAMSVPLHWNANNIPIGVQFGARFGEEATLFRLAAQLEQARPWANRKPLIHCDR